MWTMGRYHLDALSHADVGKATACRVDDQIHADALHRVSAQTVRYAPATVLNAPLENAAHGYVVDDA